MKHLKSLAVTFIAPFLLSACGGGGNSLAPTVRATASPVSTSSETKATVTFSIKVPNRSATSIARSAIARRSRTATTRGRAYIGDGTQSGTLTITQIGSTQPLSTQTFSCTDTCSTTASLIPATYTFAVALYDGANGTGDLLSSGSASKAILAGVANVVNLSFTGSVADVYVFLDEPNGTGELAVGSPATATVTVEAEDADGDTIIGAYDKAITLKSSDGVDAALSVPAVAATPVPSPGFDSSPAPVAAAQPPGATVTISSSDQQPILTWTGNGTMDYVVDVDAMLPSAATIVDAAELVVTGGATPPPAQNPVDPEITPYPRGTPVSPAPSASAAAANAVPAQLGTIGVPDSTASLMPSGNSLYAFVAGSTKTVSLGLGSQVNAENNNRTVALQQLNFAISTNTSGLATFDSLAPRRIDLNAGRVSGHGSGHVEYHERPWLDYTKGKGPARAARGRNAFSGTPTVGATSSWYVGTTSEAVTSRAIINDTKTGNARFVIWSANSSMVPASFIPTLQTDVMNADTALSTAFGDFHYSSTAPGIQNYEACNPDGSDAGVAGPGTVADPGYVNVVLFDGTVPGAAVANADGYFSSNDYTPQNQAYCYGGNSNATPTIFIQYNPGETLNGAGLDELNLVITHEYSHLLTYVLKTIDQKGPYEFSWVLEGLGSIAEDYTAPNALSGAGPLGAPTAPVYETNDNLFKVATFFSSPQSYTLTGYAGIENGMYSDGLATNYGLSYLFEKYLYDRFGNGFIHDLNTSTNEGAANIVYAADKNGAGTETFAQLYDEFVTMLAVSGTGESTDPRYNMKSFNIRGGSFAPQCAGCSPVILNGPAQAADLSPGQTMLVQNMFPGGFAFFDMNGINAKGNVIKTTDTKGQLQLFGALGQK